jgi:hypothetical protein
MLLMAVICYSPCASSTLYRQPSPQQDHDRVQIGDVGFLFRGHFIRLFSVTHRKRDHLDQEEAVPDDYEQINTGRIISDLREPQRLFAVRQREFRAGLEANFATL